MTDIKKVPVGPGQFIYTDQEGNIINPTMVASADEGISTAMKEANRVKLNRLKGEQAQLAGEAAKGNGDKASTWWPWSERALMTSSRDWCAHCGSWTALPMRAHRLEPEQCAFAPRPVS